MLEVIIYWKQARTLQRPHPLTSVDGWASQYVNYNEEEHLQCFHGRHQCVNQRTDFTDAKGSTLIKYEPITN